jgi:hypothetical protein
MVATMTQHSPFTFTARDSPGYAFVTPGYASEAAS